MNQRAAGKGAIAVWLAAGLVTALLSLASVTVRAATADFLPMRTSRVSVSRQQGVSKVVTWQPEPDDDSFGVPLYQRDSPGSRFQRSFDSESQRLAVYRNDDALQAGRFIAYAPSEPDEPTQLPTLKPEESNGRRKLLGRQRRLVDFSQSMDYVAGGGSYYVDVYLGTPPQLQTLIFDTGSNLVWTQCLCEGCKPPPSSKQFKISDSSTYSTLPCGDDTCNDPEILGTGNKHNCSGDVDAKCLYNITYLKGDSQGYMGTDVLWMFKTNGKKFSLPKFLFGCYFGGPTEEDFADGILGAGRASVSLPSQLSPHYNNIFATCLVSYNVDAKGHVAYGTAAVPSDGVTYTPLMDGEYSTAYYVEMDYVTVGDEKVSVPSSAWVDSSGSSPKSRTVLDTGTTLAYLSAAAWDPIFEAVKKNVLNATSASSQEALGEEFSPCWVLTDKSTGPVIRFFFKGGALIEVPPVGYIGEFDDSVFCNVIGRMEPEMKFNLIGALLLQDKVVVWDRQNSQIGFKDADCASDF
eukprot:TRINITY_DN3704_c0_g5_i1.p1 TRINITY_DN3704_c0_g5~~TRINITY_DN3704_c0_g5_i1.p1  ORF type:complete len:521 (+),score=61.92 TRINITY_DN3704_c0_g5_i1:873-2435(+)